MTCVYFSFLIFPGGSFPEERVSLLFLVGWVLTGVLAAHILVGGFGNPSRHRFWKGPWVVSTNSDRSILCPKATSVTSTDSYESCRSLAMEPPRGPQAAAWWCQCSSWLPALFRDVAKMATVKARRLRGLFLPTSHTYYLPLPLQVECWRLKNWGLVWVTVLHLNEFITSWISQDFMKSSPLH